MKINVLAFGVHPDDVELGCAGVLLSEKRKGKTTGIIDLTGGELGTRGTAETRKSEAKKAAELLGVDVRENLGMADGFFRNDEEHQRKIITVLRKYQPEIIIINAPEDRHPDHGRASELVTTAAFLSGLVKIITTAGDGKTQEKWRPAYVFNYIQDRYLTPDLLYDISDVMDEKLEVIRAYETQFFSQSSDNEGPQTYISKPGFLDGIKARDKMHGKLMGVDYAEGFLSKKLIGINNFASLVLNET